MAVLFRLCGHPIAFPPLSKKRKKEKKKQDYRRYKLDQKETFFFFFLNVMCFRSFFVPSPSVLLVGHLQNLTLGKWTTNARFPLLVPTTTFLIFSDFSDQRVKGVVDSHARLG